MRRRAEEGGGCWPTSPAPRKHEEFRAKVSPSCVQFSFFRNE
jgi:hypothetical protein